MTETNTYVKSGWKSQQVRKRDREIDPRRAAKALTKEDGEAAVSFPCYRYGNPWKNKKIIENPRRLSSRTPFQFSFHNFDRNRMKILGRMTQSDYPYLDE